MIHTQQVIDTIYSADTVEACPISYNVIACGTYQVDEEKNSPGHTERMGRLYLYHLENNTLIESYRDNVLAIADAKGQVILKGIETSKILDLDCLAVTDPDKLCLSLAWSNRVKKSTTDQIVVSLSTGEVCLLQVQKSGLEVLRTWKSHNYEAWITTFDIWNPSTVFSGGDDCLFKGWDLRTNIQTFTNKRHQMGVTSIQSSPHKEFELATGSYDEYVNIWDLRSMKSPISSINTGGGIWRIKYHPKDHSKILVASMYNGFHILEHEDDKWNITHEYKKHESIAYGADWIFNSDLIVTCSFYDHSLHLWKNN